MDKALLKQVKKGIEVEMEHTDDPKVALKIAMDHIKEDQVYASVQGLGDAKTLSRAYLNIIGITNINRYNKKLAYVDEGSISINGLGDYQRVIGILKRRYGKSNKRYLMFFDGCDGWFQHLKKEVLPKYIENG